MQHQVKQYIIKHSIIIIITAKNISQLLAEQQLQSWNSCNFACKHKQITQLGISF